MSRPFLIDTDTASDDAVALVMAALHPDIDIKAVTVVAGNVSLEQGLRNALYTLQLCESTVPVHAGADRPLVVPAADATWFHGRDGLGDQDYPLPMRLPADGHAVDAILSTIRANPGIEVVTLGPLTNVAMAIRQDPSIVDGVSRCVVMGGAACCEGNVTPAAEYNVWCDPEAAQIVFSSGLPIEMVGWELSRGKGNLDEDDIARVRSVDTDIAHFCIDCNSTAIDANLEQSGEIGVPLPDPIAMAIAIDPTICIDQSEHRVMVETRSELTRGMTVVDRLNVSHDDRNRLTWHDQTDQSGPVKVCWAIDNDRWKALLLELLQL
jgi:purine nucleosidase